MVSIGFNKYLTYPCPRGEKRRAKVKLIHIWDIYVFYNLLSVMVLYGASNHMAVLYIFYRGHKRINQNVWWCLFIIS